jgi:hypothetical protein
MLKTLSISFFVAALLAPISLRATDCKTDCEGHFDQWYQAPDLARCQAEREVACKTGVTTCDIWNYNPATIGLYQTAILAVETANRNTSWPATANDCHSIVDLGQKASSTMGAAKFAIQVWETGFKAAQILNEASVLGAVVAEGVKSFAHCACTNAKYETPEEHKAENDRYSVSIFNGRWTVWRGANSEQSRKNLLQNALNDVGGKYESRFTSVYGSGVRTLTEGLCDEGSYWVASRGEESSKMAAEELKNRGWGHCLFRTRNFAAQSPTGLNDIYYISLGRRDGKWALRWADSSDKANAKQIAETTMGGSWDTAESAFFSSTRPTLTYLTCTDVPKTVDGVTSQASSIQSFAGYGLRSLSKAFEKASSVPNSTCTFQTRDAGFGQ